MRGGWQIIRVVECGSSGSWNNRVFWRKCGWKSTFWSPLGKTNPPTPSKKFLRMFGLKKNSTLSARFLSVSVTKLRVLSFLLFTLIEAWKAVKTFSADPQGSGIRILRVVEFACAVYSRQQRASRSNQFGNKVNKNIFSWTAPMHVESAFENKWNGMNKN